MRFQLNFGTSHPLTPFLEGGGRSAPPGKFRTKNTGLNRVKASQAISKFDEYILANSTSSSPVNRGAEVQCSRQFDKKSENPLSAICTSNRSSSSDQIENKISSAASSQSFNERGEAGLDPKTPPYV